MTNKSCKNLSDVEKSSTKGKCKCKHERERKPKLFKNLKKSPPPPQLPRNFCWTGRYLVSDLNANVDFTWRGNNGDMQMIAGNEKSMIHFTNLIFNQQLFTYTYRWPGLQPELLPPLEPCHPLFKFSLEELNQILATSTFVGKEILQEGKKCLKVNHFRLSIVLPRFPPGFYPRLPILSADIYVDRKDSTKFVKVLHFGLQNIYDPNLDEWIIINKTSDHPGKIVLPEPCTQSAVVASDGKSLEQFTNDLINKF